MRPEDIAVGDILYYFRVTKPKVRPRKLFFYKIEVLAKPRFNHIGTTVSALLLDYYATKPMGDGRNREFPSENCYKIEIMTSGEKCKWVRSALSLLD